MIRRRALLTAAAAPALAALSPARKQLLLSPTSRVPPGVTLDLSFMTPGTLDPRITFTRASTATYFDSTGTMQTAATNLWLQSGDASNAAWLKTSVTVAAPVVTGNQTIAPDGTNTAARIVYPAVPTGVNASSVNQTLAATAAAYSFSVWLKGNVGGEVLYLYATPDAVLYYRQQCTLTTAWQRFTLTTPALTAGPWFYQIGNDGRNGGPSTLAQTVFAWGAQVELGSSATFYIPTTTVANGAPRWDYNPTTHVLNGLLIEEARINQALQSADLSNAVWTKANITSAAPTVTGNKATAPDGTLTAAQIVYPVVSAAGAASIVFQGITATAAAYTFSIYLRGSAGGEQLYLELNAGSTYVDGGRITLTTAWQRYTVSATLTAAAWSCIVGTDLRDGGQTSTPAQTVLAWGGQIELGAFATSYIPTTAASVTRAVDVATMTTAGWFTSPGGSWMAEFISNNPLVAASFRRVVTINAAASIAPITVDNTASRLGQYDGTGAIFTANAITVGVIAKGATTWSVGASTECLNGSAVVSSAALTGGYSSMVGGGVRFLSNATPAEGMSGYIRRVRYWPRALTNAELQSVTT